MRIALISDIHGNFVALQTVLADIEHEHIDQIVCLGDVTADGPQPVETIRRIQDLGCPVVRGNTDEWFFVPQTYDPNSEKERISHALKCLSTMATHCSAFTARRNRIPESSSRQRLTMS